MNISQWPMSRIMQLPDFCFGRRWQVSCSAKGVVVGPNWDIAEIAFPEHIVLWELNLYSVGSVTTAKTFRLALGDQLPTSGAMMDALEPFLPGLGITGPEPRLIMPLHYGSLTGPMLRTNIHTAGQRLVLEVSADVTASDALVVIVIVSSLPTEAPDWLVSR